MNARTLLSSLFAAALPFVLVAAGCSSTITNGVNRDAGGNDTGNSGGGASCTSASKCFADPAPTPSEIQACRNAQNDPICGSIFTMLLSCEFASQMCDASGHTVQSTACNTLATAYGQCVSLDAGGPPSEAGPCSLPATDCTCDMNSSGGACVSCCQANHPSGSATFIAALKGCLCGGAGACQAQCAATYCATPSAPADAPCDACIQTSLSANPPGACYNQVLAACNANVDCPPDVNCTAGCPNTP